MLENRSWGNRFEDSRSLEIESERYGDERERGLHIGASNLLFSVSRINDVTNRVAESRASRQLRDVESEIRDFVDFAQETEIIFTVEGLAELSLEDRVALAIEYEKSRKERFSEREYKRAEVNTPFRVAVFLPTVKRREELLGQLPQTIQGLIKSGSVELDCFADINDFTAKTGIAPSFEDRTVDLGTMGKISVKAPQEKKIYDLVVDTGIKVFTGVNEDGVVESKIGDASLSDIADRGKVADRYIAIFDQEGHFREHSYQQVPGKDYLRTIDDRALPLLREIESGQRIIYVGKTKKINVLALKHLKLIGAVDENGGVTETGRKILGVVTKLGCSSQSARIIIEAESKEMVANGILLDYLSRHEEPSKDIPFSVEQHLNYPQKYFQSGLVFAEWNKFLSRSNSGKDLLFLSKEDVPLGDRQRRLRSIIGDADVVVLRSIIGLAEDAFRLSRDGNGPVDLERVKNLAKIKEVKDIDILRMLIAGYSGNVMEVEASFGPMLDVADARLVRPASKEVLIENEIMAIAGNQKYAERTPYLVLSLNNRRIIEPERGVDARERVSDPIVRSMNGWPSNYVQDVIGPFVPLSPELLAEVSPEAWKDVEVWYRGEHEKREQLIKKNAPDALAGPAELASLKDVFGDRNPFQ